MKFFTLFITAIILCISISSCAENSNNSVESDTGNTGLTESSSDPAKDFESNSDEMQSDDIT